jgi:amino acid adenylation domain-containing protein
VTTGLTPATPPAAARLSEAKRALLTQRLRQRAAVDEPTIPRRPDDGAPLLSFAQERLWFMEQYAPGTAAYNIPVVRRLRGPLDVAALRRAYRELMARHETLRSRFPVTDDGRPALVVAPEPETDLTVAELSTVDEAVELVSAEGAAPFDIATGPLIRGVLVCLAPDDHVLSVVVHHMVADGWSTDVLMRDLFALYRAEPLPELPVTYGDYAAWQRERLTGAAFDGDVSYWRGQLAGVEPLELPTDRPRPAQQTFNGAAHGITLDAEVRDALTALGRVHGATPYMVLLAAFAVLLARWSGQRDFAVGSPIAGRPHRELEGLVGMFVNMLALRARLDDDPTFADLVARVRETALDAYAHQELPFAVLVSELKVPRDVRRSPVFQAILAVQNYGGGGVDDQPGLTVEHFTAHASGTRFDLELVLLETPDGLRGAFNYNSDLFTPDTVARLAGHFDTLLRALVARPDARVSTVDLGGAGETAGFNPTAAPYPDTATLHGLVEAQVDRTPDATAVEFDGRTLTYAELDARANRVAHRLRGLGVGPDTLVAVCAERSTDLVVGLLGVLKSGAAYVPLDPEYPAQRLAFMLADADAPVLLTQRHLAVPAGTATALYLDDEPQWRDQPAGRPGQAAAPDDVAYMIYTSGSTGQPKGVPNTHRGIVNRLDWMQKAYRLGADDVVLQKTPASFDVSVWEFFWPLLTGARLVLAKPGGHKDPEYLRDLIVHSGVTTVHFVPSMLAVFLGTDGVADCTTLRRIVCSGEELPAALARRCTDLLPADLHNLYGPTEAAVDVSAWHCPPGSDLSTVPIGAPIQNIRLHVLDERFEPQPVGVPGQLYIAGVGLARGYHRRPELTAERFLPDPFGPPGARMYATGDKARWRADGHLEFLGRLDEQVKLRGLRIELGEIAAVLRAQPGVADAAVVVRADARGDKRIVAYVVAEVPPGDLRAALKRSLPDYMVPSAFVALDALPLSPSGKLDRKALPAPDTGRQLTTEAVEPRTDTERMLAGIWREVLEELPRLGIDDDFFDLGGHSLLATQVVASVRRAAEERGLHPVSLMDLFANPTIRDLAALVDTPVAERGGQALLHRLTAAGEMAGSTDPTLSLVCVPYGGGSAIVYKPLADALPDGYALWSVAIPGHDVGLSEERLPFEELARRVADEVLAKVSGPVALYGHCGVGSALIVEIARLLEAAGRDLTCVYIGAIFPFARPRGRVLSALAKLAALEPLLGDRVYANWLTAMGADMAGLTGEQRRFIIRNMRRDSTAAEEYFTARLADGTARLRAPIVSVVGERDPAAEYYQERYEEWHFLSDSVSLVVLDEAGHFFLKYRAGELAGIVTRAHRPDEPLPARKDDAGWWLHGRSTAAARPSTVDRASPGPSLGRFLLVALGQLVSITGSALTEFAIPIWIYLHTGSLVRFALFAVLGLVPGILVAPLAGAVVDRLDRRRVMLAGDCAAGATQAVLLALVWGGHLQVWHIYVLLVSLSVALTFQRLAWGSAIPQLVPKRYLGHANGIVQMTGGVAQFLVPLFAVGLLAAVGLRGILILDVASYAFAIAVVLALRFPRTMGWRRHESLGTEIVKGFRYSWGQRGFRSMLLFFAVLNVFLSPLFVLVTPLVLSFSGLGTVARVAVAAGLGTTLGGLAMGFWGGPNHRRLRGVLLATLALAACCALTGLRAQALVVGAGAFGMALGLALVNGIYTTIVQVKVPQRFHGRVFALNTVIAWSTLPLGFGLVAPYSARLAEPLMRDGGPLASTAGALIGTGPGRGIGLLYLVFALAMAVLVLVAWRTPALARFDDEVPDAPPDDLVGLQERDRRRRPEEDNT